MKVLERISLNQLAHIHTPIMPDQFEVMLSDDEATFTTLEIQLMTTIIALHAGMKDAHDEAQAKIEELQDKINRAGDDMDLTNRYDSEEVERRALPRHFEE
jgi:ArsR family metal-binding transcriptional regulator